MYKPFFPNLAFAWAFLGVLAAILSVAAYVDHRRMVVPKWLTVPLLALGMAVNVARGAWLGSAGGELWMCSTGSVWLGLVDGFLFALIGAIVGFFVLFALWILGTCGGGDVKLFTALGAWVGPLYLLYVLLMSMAVLLVLVVVKAISGGIDLKAMRQGREWAKRRAGKAANLPAAPKWRISYSLPVAIATLVVLVWIFKAEFKLSALFPQDQKVVANAR